MEAIQAGPFPKEPAQGILVQNDREGTHYRIVDSGGAELTPSLCPSKDDVVLHLCKPNSLDSWIR